MLVIKVIRSIFNGTLIKKIRTRLLRYKKFPSDKEYLIAYGKISLKYTMNLDNPKTFNEYLNWYKLNYKNDLMPICVDKYRVREHIKNKGLESLLVQCYGVYDSIDDIDLNQLPDHFVAKVTGDSGGVVICKNKKDFYKEARIKFKKMKKDYSNRTKEWPYHYVDNKIIIEDLIKTENGDSPNDYKFFCFNGEPKFLYVASERNTKCKFDFFDLQWNHMDVVQNHPQSTKKIQKPKRFDEMLKICRILSQEFPHVRVDLYYENDKIYFGELTFFHMAGLTPFSRIETDYMLGRYFE